MSKPNLFIVGAAKSGTTSLHHYLSQHPNIFMSTPKELNFFCFDFWLDREHNDRNFFIFNKKSYLNYFLNSKENIVGESSPYYLYSKVAAKEIYKFNPDAKIIIMLREPVAFMYSLYLHNKRNIHEKSKTFENALEQERVESIYTNQNFLVDKLFYRKFSNFHKQIKRFLDIFESKNIKIILFDDFKKDAEKEFLDVLSFLGLEEFKLESYNIRNKGKNIDLSNSYKFFKTLQKKISNSHFKILLPYSFRVKLGEKIFNMYQNKNKKFLIDSQLKFDLMREKKKEVVALNEVLFKNNLIDSDLVKLWGYDKIK